MATKEANNKVDYMDLVERLGGDLVTLQAMRAPDAGGVSPGKFMVVEMEGEEVRIDPPLIRAIHGAIKSAMEEARHDSNLAG